MCYLLQNKYEPPPKKNQIKFLEETTHFATRFSKILRDSKEIKNNEEKKKEDALRGWQSQNRNNVQPVGETGKTRMGKRNKKKQK